MAEQMIKSSDKKFPTTISLRLLEFINIKLQSEKISRSKNQNPKFL